MVGLWTGGRHRACARARSRPHAPPAPTPCSHQVPRICLVDHAVQPALCSHLGCFSSASRPSSAAALQAKPASSSVAAPPAPTCATATELQSQRATPSGAFGHPVVGPASARPRPHPRHRPRRRRLRPRHRRHLLPPAALEPPHAIAPSWTRPAATPPRASGRPDVGPALARLSRPGPRPRRRPRRPRRRPRRPRTRARTGRGKQRSRSMAGACCRGLWGRYITRRTRCSMHPP